ncbi:MAG: hypothetical protein WD069_07815 [Planctomycetales bacterium]
MSGTGLLLLVAAALIAADDHPISESERQRLTDRLERGAGALDQRIEKDPKSIELLSHRGDLRMFLGRSEEAIADYDRMIELDPRYEKSHWRRGIARFYADDFAGSVKQFDMYHEEDDVDRENGIWRYFAQCKGEGRDKAQEGLLKYTKEDRPPFQSLYDFFQDKIKAEDVLAEIDKAPLEGPEKKRRLFYAHLYIGLDHAVADRKEEARKHLRQAIANDWAPYAQYGPRYMWNVARVQYDLLAPQPEKRPAKPKDPGKLEPVPDPGAD